jgi:hypothetical protein
MTTRPAKPVVEFDVPITEIAAQVAHKEDAALRQRSPEHI